MAKKEHKQLSHRQLWRLIASRADRNNSNLRTYDSYFGQNAERFGSLVLARSFSGIRAGDVGFVAGLFFAHKEYLDRFENAIRLNMREVLEKESELLSLSLNDIQSNGLRSRIDRLLIKQVIRRDAKLIKQLPQPTPIVPVVL